MWPIKVSQVCSVKGCTNPRRYTLRGGLCSTHYVRLRKYGSVHAGGVVRLYGRRRCEVKGCDRPHHAQGYCSTHYTRFRIHGSVHMVRRYGQRHCEVEGCDRSHHAQGLCRQHYYQAHYLWHKVTECAVCGGNAMATSDLCERCSEVIHGKVLNRV